MLLTNYSGAFWWDSNQFGTNELRILPLTRGKSTYFTEDPHGTILGKGLIPGGKEKDKARQAVFPTPTNPLVDDLEEEVPHDDKTVPQKAPCVTTWKHNQDAAHWSTTAKSFGSRNIILANRIICNHGTHNNTRRMH